MQNLKSNKYIGSNEQGSALIIAIMLLAIMSILGTMMMSTSTTEIQLSGNYRNNQQSFYTADRAVTYAMRSASDGSSVIDLYNDQNTALATTPLHRDLIADGLSELEPSTWSATDDRNSVSFIGTSAPPVGVGSDANVFVARNYAVNTVGIFPANSPRPSRTEIRSQFSKLVPK